MPPSVVDIPESRYSIKSIARPLRLHQRLQRWRLLSRGLFFFLFLCAPVLDLFRLDLYAGSFVFFGRHLSLGLSPFLREGGMDPVAAGVSVLTHAILPVLAIIGLVVVVSWHFGRLYCGWLCPHFSVVEMLNGLMRRTLGKPTFWERRDSSFSPPGRLLAWLPVAAAALAMAFIWAVSMLTYLLPPEVVFQNLLHGHPTPNQSRFLGVATGLLFLDFLFFRHLFCRFGCAAGLFQSLVWMGNRTALTPLFQRQRAVVCQECPQSCDTVCPMRLKPRGGKNRIATCTQCGLCTQACARERQDTPGSPPLGWQRGERVSSLSGSYVSLPDSISAKQMDRS
ncbi:MAG: 4Fe-4S binding protein [Magnetococcales bacterium]|nr:4Fe-4S binding protein [Magnetococcales bacterium]